MALKDIKPALALSQELSDSLDESLLRSLVEGLKDLALLKADAKGVTERLDKAEAPYRQWLAENEGKEIVDGELGLRAYLKDKKKNRGPEDVDLQHMREVDATLFERLFKAGALTVNYRVLDAKPKECAGWTRFKLEPGVTSEFHIGAVE